MLYAQFAAAVSSLAPTRREIARMLGVSPRMVQYYVAGLKAPKPAVAKKYPHIDAALSADFAAMNLVAQDECKE